MSAATSRSVLVVGATGRTGRCLVEQLLERGHEVHALARSREKLPERIRSDPRATVVEASVLDLSDEELAALVRGRDAVVSCLGHVLSLRGMYGQPRRLCTEAARRLCAAIERGRPARPVRFVLMSSVGVPNPELDQRRPWYERWVLTLLRHAVPPHRDNEEAARHLRRDRGRRSELVEWCVVRPDSLIDAEVSAHAVEPSPTTGLFSGRPTARADVARFMLELIEDDELWGRWRFEMPVVTTAEE